MNFRKLDAKDKTKIIKLINTRLEGTSIELSNGVTVKFIEAIHDGDYFILNILQVEDNFYCVEAEYDSWDDNTLIEEDIRQAYKVKKVSKTIEVWERED